MTKLVEEVEEHDMVTGIEGRNVLHDLTNGPLTQFFSPLREVTIVLFVPA